MPLQHRMIKFIYKPDKSLIWNEKMDLILVVSGLQNILQRMILSTACVSRCLEVYVCRCNLFNNNFIKVILFASTYVNKPNFINSVTIIT